MNNDLKEIKKELRKLANPQKAKILKKFFKTGKGEYGEGDQFLGITVPLQRKVVKDFSDLSLRDIQKLLESPVHEERLTALFVLISHFQKATEEKNEKQRKEIFDFYFKNAKRVNNWDLVDLSAPKISGEYLLDQKKDVLFELAHSQNLWEKRIAILSTFAFIKRGEWKDTFKISQILLNDEHDIIHKACGWMLREVGNRVSQKKEEEFLKKYYQKMPRTMLRYAIEKFPETKRQKYLKGLI